MIKLLITGGSGYVGTRLINRLLKKDNIKIINYDISFFGDKHLPESNNFRYYKEDIRNPKKFAEVLKENKVDTVLHLACISNDPTFELNNSLSKEINFDCFEPLVKTSKENGVKKFIYASTCSVYGISESPNVTEDHPLVPLTDYNKFKAKCEPILNSYADEDFNTITIRPATVCGYSEKMRFDLTVNILTNFAYNKGFIKVLGGEQYRPNVHIDDMCNLYNFLIFNEIKKYNKGVYNVGTENLKVIDIAKKIKSLFKKILDRNIDIKIEPSNDNRSYQINSDKIQNQLGFKFRLSVDDAVTDLIEAFESKKLTDTFSEEWQNIAVLKKLKEESKFK